MSDPDVDQLTAALIRLYAESPEPIQQQQPGEQQQQVLMAQRQTSLDSGGGGCGRCEDALDDLVRELHAENLHLRERLRAAQVEHGHRVRCLVDTLDRMQKEVAEMSSRRSAAVKRPKSDCTDQASASAASSATACCCHAGGLGRIRRRSLSIGEDARELATALAQACQELRGENNCLMQQLRQIRYRPVALRSSQRRRDARQRQAEEELAEVREELHRLRVAVLEASVRHPGIEALLLKP